MSHSLLDQHRPLLERALETIATRGYWSAYAESPSPRAYGEGAPEAGRAAFESHLGKPFELDQPGQCGWHDGETSPYGVPLGIRYPQSDPQALVQAAQAAMPAWQAQGAEGRVGICLEILQQLNRRSFEIAHAVMMTSGQGWMMAFQAGGPHAQDRGLEAVAYAWREMSFIPAESVWEKPQGKHPSLVMRKHYEIVGRGVAVVIGCATFPTWNTYPGLFAALATGNPVILKPHDSVVLPAAITIRTIRAVLAENGLDPNLATLCLPRDQEATRTLCTHPEVRSIDYTGGNTFGHWLLDHCRQAQVYAELAGVNSIVIDSTDDYDGMLRNLAFTLSLYSGQMCTTSQAIVVPAQGIDTDQGPKSFDQVGQDLAQAIGRLVEKPETALAVLGAIQSDATLARIDEAAGGGMGQVVLAPRTPQYDEFPHARARTPVLLACDARDAAHYAREQFGPISFLVRAGDTEAALALAEDLARQHGALTLAVYSTRDRVLDAAVQVSWRAKVALSLNLTGGVFVNQSAAFSDFHGTGGNPAANASYADSAFVANRFRVVQRRMHA
ncbi:MAG TPA: phenylacetic acid degradation protein PaaN [Castellaniella sp.]|nr:phenylacetic acid degradation protein PaaN [Castellaniella sp.]